MGDDEIIPFLLTLRFPTFFAVDSDFSKRTLCHIRYSLVHLGVKQSEAAVFMRQFLRHPEFKVQARRMGSVIHVGHSGITVWRLHAEQELHFNWTHQIGR